MGYNVLWFSSDGAMLKEEETESQADKGKIHPYHVLEGPLPPPSPPLSPSTLGDDSALCSMCGREITHMPRNESGECVESSFLLSV